MLAVIHFASLIPSWYMISLMGLDKRLPHGLIRAPALIPHGRGLLCPCFFCCYMIDLVSMMIWVICLNSLCTDFIIMTSLFSLCIVSIYMHAAPHHFGFMGILLPYICHPSLSSCIHISLFYFDWPMPIHMCVLLSLWIYVQTKRTLIMCI